MNHPVIDVCGFPIDGDMGLKKWGSHFDVRYQISNHGRNKFVYNGSAAPEYEAGPGTWCYYVVVEEGMLSAGDFERFWLPPSESRHRNGAPCYDYSNAAFSNVHWHGGITFYEKQGGLDGDIRLVKMGCDFAHYWDDGRMYDFASVEHEAKKTIDELRAMFKFKRRCSSTGTWHPEDEMVKTERGHLIGPESAAEIAKEAT